MRIRVAPRYVPPPWARRRWGRISVGTETGLEPEPGPLELYRSAFPWRRVVWNAREQLWEIRQRDPVTDEEYRYEFVFAWDAPPDSVTGELPSDDEVARMIEERSPRLVRVYRHFDHEFVWERLRQAHEFQRLGPKRYVNRVAELNARARGSRLRYTASENAAALAEIRRFLPALEGTQPAPVVRGWEAT